MKIYDVSVPLTGEMHNWPGDPMPEIVQIQGLSKGGACNVQQLKLTTHNGTHVDAPFHMLQNGKKMDELPLDNFVGEAQVIEIADPIKIEAAEIARYYQKDVTRVLFKTKNSGRWSEKKFFTDYVYLTPEGADFLVKQKVKLVGIDYLSIDEYGNKLHLPHKKLLSQDIVILEGLNLSQIEPGKYDMICLPLKLLAADGAPARVILRR